MGPVRHDFSAPLRYYSEYFWYQLDIWNSFSCFSSLEVLVVFLPTLTHFFQQARELDHGIHTQQMFLGSFKTQSATFLIKSAECAVTVLNSWLKPTSEWFSIFWEIPWRMIHWIETSQTCIILFTCHLWKVFYEVLCNLCVCCVWRQMKDKGKFCLLYIQTRATASNYTNTNICAVQKWPFLVKP